MDSDRDTPPTVLHIAYSRTFIGSEEKPRELRDIIYRVFSEALDDGDLYRLKINDEFSKFMEIDSASRRKEDSELREFCVRPYFEIKAKPDQKDLDYAHGSWHYESVKIEDAKDIGRPKFSSSR